ncbi:MAG: hypothetical protein HYV09_09485 [Deltaproteobacteria bacterium]|nr:hypothetical protein [Deltaproteobacteria bacterium]
MRSGSLFACAVIALSPGAARAEEKAPSESPARKEEGGATELPSVAGRPIRRFAQRNVLELGGSVSYVKSNAFTQIGATPTFGWFVIEYMQVSILPSVEYVKTFSAPGEARYSLLLEPSFHFLLAGPVFLFFGAGTGAVYEKETGMGLAVAPRTGLEVLVGGSGVLKLATTFVYTATRRTAIEDGTNEPHTSTFGLQAGYAVAW